MSGFGGVLLKKVYEQFKNCLRLLRRGEVSDITGKRDTIIRKIIYFNK